MAGTVSAGTIIYDVDMDTAGILRGRRDIDAALSGLNGSMGRLEASVNRTERSIGSMERTMSSLSSVAKGLIAALSVQQVASYADAWTELNNKVSNSIRTGETQAEVMQRIFDISQATQSTLNGTATLYSRLERGTRTYNTSAEDLARLTTIINQGFAVSGATAQEAENAIIQLSQGIASGVLRGEEFNSVSEQGSRLMIALADSAGVTIGQLRKMAAEGKLTTDVVVNGLLSQGDAIGKEFEKTTVSIAKGLQVAGNNVTKFFGENATVKSFAAGFRDSVVTISENLDALSTALFGAAALMGGRYVGALTLATAHKVKLAIAARNEAAAEALAAKAAADKTAADLRSALIAKERALDEVRLSQLMKQTAISATNAATAEQRLSAARVEAATLTDNYNRALAANAAAQSTANAAAASASITVRSSLSRALSMIGGPAGLAVLAASAIFYFSQRAKEARDNANSLADSANELGAKFEAMSHTQLAATIGKLSENLPELSTAVAEAKKELDEATAAVERQQKEIKNWGTNTTRGRQAAEALGGAQNKLAIATDNWDQANRRYSQTLSAIDIARANLNGTMRQGIDLLRRDSQEASTASAMMNQLGKMINFASREKEKFNSSSLVVQRPKDIQDYLDKQQDQIDLQAEFNDKKRAQLKAEQDVRALAEKDQSTPDETENYVTMARERAGAEFDLQKQQEQRRKEQKEGEQQDKKSANTAESIAQKLSNLKQQSELAADSTKELSREQAILTAQQSLGKGATEAQIRLAGQYAAKTWDVANALKMRQQAEQAGRFVNQEVAAGKTSVDPVTGAVEDPTAQIALEEQQKLQALQLYQDQGVLSVQQYEDAKTAIQLQASNARKVIAQTEANQQAQAIGSILSSASSGFDSLANMIENAGGKSSGAYLAMFAASKAFAIAQSTLSLNMAIMQAMADPTALTPYQKLANYAAIASAGASLLSNVASVTLSGAREHGGPVSANSMYRVGEGGKPEIFRASNGSQYMIPGDNGKVISNKDMQGAGGTGAVIQQEVHFHIQTTGGIDDATMAKMSTMMRQVSLNTIKDQQRPNGLLQRSR